jgi:REP element-mobilizing transposase RayT
MARPLRIELAGGLYHVTSRGDRREDIFICEGDRHVWLEIFDVVCKRLNWVCHAWCQMTNHYHVVVEIPGLVQSCRLNHKLMLRCNLQDCTSVGKMLDFS